jgi:hypothetical protein
MSRLSRQYGILNISQPYRPPRPVTGMVRFGFKHLEHDHTLLQDRKSSSTVVTITSSVETTLSTGTHDLIGWTREISAESTVWISCPWRAKRRTTSSSDSFSKVSCTVHCRQAVATTFASRIKSYSPLYLRCELESS